MIEKPSIDKNNILCFMLHSIAHIQDLADNVMNMLPDTIKHRLSNIVIQVENFATSDMLEDLNIDSRYDLLGLYRGIPATSRLESNDLSVIFLFRGPIIRYVQEFQEPIESVIKQIIVQEIAHHFGMRACDLYFRLNHQKESF
ncbi:MAG: hypothetical protein NEHIOOID_00383 [Holosporales bacterium]